MNKSKNIKLFFFIFFLVILVFYFFKFEKKKSITIDQKLEFEENSYNSNIILDIEYIAKDEKGNSYRIIAKKGEIDLSNANIIFLTEVNGIIEMVDSSKIKIKSDFGKYNVNNYDTIFSKNVIVDYLDNKITGEYLDFSMLKNLLMISKNVVYTNIENILYADIIEMNIKTKDIQISMYEKDKKVQIKSKN